MDRQEAIDTFRALLAICDEAAIEPLDARFATPSPPDDNYAIHIRLAPEGESDPDTVAKVSLTLDDLERLGSERGFHVRRSMYYTLFTA